MTVTRFLLAASSVVLSAWLMGCAVAAAEPQSVAAAPAPAVGAPRGIGFTFEWGDDDDDWENTATWECPTGCTIIWEEGPEDPVA